MKRLYVIVALLVATGLSAQTQTDIYTIQSQMDSTGASLWVDSTVTVEGIVSAGYGVTGSRNFFLEMRQGGPYSGIMVYVPSSAGDFPVQLGESLRITGTVSEYRGNTELGVSDTTNIQRLGVVSPITPTLITCDYLDTASTTTIPWDSAEAYEGVLIKVNNVVVTDTMDANGNWQVSDGNGYVYVNNNYSYTPALYDRLNITGIVQTNYGLYKIRPRSDADFEFLNAGISNVYAEDAQVIRVEFKSNMDQNAEDASKYVITPSITIDHIALDANDSSVVRIYTTDMAGGTLYTLITSGLQDAYGQDVNDTVTFYGGFTSIATIQSDTVAGDSTGNYPTNWAGRVVTITGIVTANKDHFDYPFYFVQQGDTPFSGIQIWDPQNAFSPQDGDSVIIVGQVTEYNGATEFSNIVYGKVVSSGHTVAPITVNTGDLIPGAGFVAEGYEGVLVKVDSAMVTDAGTGSNFVVDDGTGGVTITNIDHITYTPNYGDILNVTGIMRFIGQLYPRDDNDVEYLGSDVAESPSSFIRDFKINALERGKLSFNITLSRSENISVSVYNILGAKVYGKSFGKVTKGSHTFNVPTRLSRGVYFVDVKFASQHMIGRAVITR